MGRLLASLVTLLVLALGAAFVVPALVDWNSYRPAIEEAASSILGRKISIDGDLDIVLLPEPHVHAGRVSAAGGSGAPLLTSEAVDVSLSLQGLLGGSLDATSLKLVHPVLTLDLSVPAGERQAKVREEFPLSAEADSVEIEEGRIEVLAKQPGPRRAVTLDRISGTLLAPHEAPSTFRFSGHFDYSSRTFDTKFAASPASGGIFKLNGGASDQASKTLIQADGVVSTGDEPAFDGAVGITMGRQGIWGALPFGLQAKSRAHLTLSRASLSELGLTLSSDDRPQTMTGAMDIDYAEGAVELSLDAPSIDAEALLGDDEGTSASPQAIKADAIGRARDWSGLLWFYPSATVRLAFSANQIQRGGELIENVRVEALRRGGQWTVNDAEATLPGEARASIDGTLASRGSDLKFVGRMRAEGKNLKRAVGFLSPQGPGGLALPSKPFAIRSAVTLSPALSAFDGIAGELDGGAFTAGLKIERQQGTRLRLWLASDRLDLNALTATQPRAPSPLDAARLAWRSLVSRLSGGSQVATAEIDLSAKALATGPVEVKNFAFRAMLTPDLLTIAKLNAETAEGLLATGEGAVPLHGAGLGKFEGRLEARSAAAVLQAMVFAGYGAEDLGARRPDDLAPAVFSVIYTSDLQSQTASLALQGNAAAVRVEGRGQIKGPVADLRAAQLQGQFTASSADGAKLVGLMFPASLSTPGASQTAGAATVKFEGTLQRLRTNASIKAAALQAQLDGVVEFQSGGPVFSGKAAAVSQTPELFVPPPVLAFLGGEPKVSLRAESSLILSRNRLAADALRAETPQSVVTGRLLLDASGAANAVEADLKADRFALGRLMGVLLARSDQAASVPVAMGRPAIWSERPFALSILNDTVAKIAIAAKALKLTDTMALADGQVIARIEKGRLDVQRLAGKAFGGDLSASFLLDVQAALPQASISVSLDNGELAAFAEPGATPLLSGKVAVRFAAQGQGLSPRGLVSVLTGRGQAAISDGRISRMSPAAVQKVGDELIGLQQQLGEDAIKRRLLDAAQTADFKFAALRVPFVVHDGILEIPRASFRGKDATVRMQALVDQTALEADSTWQLGVNSDRRQKWPPIKLVVAGAPGQLGSRPRTVVADDFIRAVLMRKMEGDISKLESIGRPQSSQQPWSATQEPSPRPAQPKRNEGAANTSPAAGPAQPAVDAGSTDFEARVRGALQSH